MKGLVPVLVIVLCLFLLFYANDMRRQGTIFTCTTFFDFEKHDRWTSFCRAIDAILEHETPETLSKISRWVVINEYSKTPKADWSQKVQSTYPFIEVIQKTEFSKGQAASMNLILDLLVPYKFWLHWEDTWYPRTSCLGRAFTIMESTQITQLQMTQHKEKPNWLDVQEDRIHCANGYCLIDPSKDVLKYIHMSPYDAFHKNVFDNWPLYSLLPSINRASFYSRLGHFSTDPKLWPIRFEWDYARRWYLAGGIKAVLEDGPVIRKNDHVSTYDTK
jgi:hypothetical protein